MTSSPDETVLIEEVPIEKPGTSPWVLLGALAVVIGIVFGVRTIRKRRRRARPAEPTTVLPA